MSGITTYIPGLRRRESPPAFRVRKKQDPNEACSKAEPSLGDEDPAAPLPLRLLKQLPARRCGYRLWLVRKNHLIHASECAVTRSCAVINGLLDPQLDPRWRTRLTTRHERQPAKGAHSALGGWSRDTQYSCEGARSRVRERFTLDAKSQSLT